MVAYVGEIRMFAGNFAPAGWMFCQGQSLPISENEVLFQLIGTTYGGDGEQSFNLPNLASRVPMHLGSSSGTTYQLGEQGGVESVTLTVNQLANHTHAFLASTAAANSGSPGNQLIAQSTQRAVYYEGNTTTNLAANSLAQVGGNQPHDNLQPYLAINFIISLYGIFPSPT